MLASPYGRNLVAYYELMLVDAPFAHDPARVAVVEPERDDGPLLAPRDPRGRPASPCAAAAAASPSTSSPSSSVTFVGAVQAVRGVIWFALAAAAILPVALDGLLTKADVAAPRVNRIISLAALAGLAVALLAFVARPRRGSCPAGPSARRGRARGDPRPEHPRSGRPTAPPTGSSGASPTFAAALAYDVRFELYDEHALDELITYGRREAGWRAVVDGYRVVVVDEAAHLKALTAEPGARIAYRGDDLVVVRRG